MSNFIVMDASNSITDHFTEASLALREKKEKLFIDRLKGLGHDIELKDYIGSRFKRFVIESSFEEGIETWYFDDGSIDGLKVVSFIRKRPQRSLVVQKDDNSFFFDMSERIVFHAKTKEELNDL